MKIVIKSYLRPAFLICVTILAVAGGSKSIVIKQLGVKLTKMPLPLKKPLGLMSDEKSAPYKIIRKSEIENEVKPMKPTFEPEFLVESRQSGTVKIQSTRSIIFPIPCL